MLSRVTSLCDSNNNKNLPEENVQETILTGMRNIRNIICFLHTSLISVTYIFTILYSKIIAIKNVLRFWTIFVYNVNLIIQVCTHPSNTHCRRRNKNIIIQILHFGWKVKTFEESFDLFDWTNLGIFITLYAIILLNFN